MGMARHTTSVVVTGIGLLTGLGWNRESTWAAMKAGRSAARFIDVPDPADDRPWVACPAPGRDESRPVHGVLKRCVLSAKNDADLFRGTFDPERGAALIGLSKG